MATFFNQATLSYSGGVINSNITIGELLESVSLTKTAVVDNYTRNSEVTYAVNIINSGMASYTDLTLTDDLGAYSFEDETLYPLDYVEGSVKYFVNGVLQTAPDVTSDPPLVISEISLPARGVVTILYTARANNFAPLGDGAQIQNTVTLNGTCVNAVTATETITAQANAELTISKSLCPTTVMSCEDLTYTFVIQNTGNAEADSEDNIIVRDVFDPVLKNLTVTYNGSPLTENTDYTYNETTGVFQTVEGRITVPAATFSQNPTTGEWIITPGTSVLTVTGNV